MFSRFLLTGFILVALLACGPADEFDGAEQRLRFHVTVGEEPFSCAAEFENLGTSAATAHLTDFRFYVHDFEVVDAQGRVEPVRLVDDGRWQNEEVALIDPTDGSGHCANTPSEQNDQVRLLLPAGEWTGLRFKLGVPFELNHIDVTTAPAPLNMPSMFWSWNAGYKFLRLDMPADENPTFRFHLGSTMCQPEAGGGVSHCDYPNRPQVVLEDFDVTRHDVRFDLAALLRTSDLNQHTEHTPQGCMATENDPDCAGLFDVLGLTAENGRVAEDVFFKDEGSR